MQIEMIDETTGEPLLAFEVDDAFGVRYPTQAERQAVLNSIRHQIASMSEEEQRAEMKGAKERKAARLGVEAPCMLH